MRTTHKALIVAISTALLTTPTLYAQVRDPGTAKSPSGPSTSAPLGEASLPGQLCSGPTGPTGITGASGTTGGCPADIIGGGPVTTQFEVTGCEGVVLDANIGLDVTHSWVGDLIFTVTGPDSTAVTIFDKPGTVSGDGCSGHNIFAVLDDDGATPVENECAGGIPTINGTFSPNNPLSAFIGADGNGIWQLTITDTFPSADNGTLNDWSVDLTCGEPVPRATFEVNKVFADGNPGEVDVTINCFTGLPITQTQTISESQNVVFVVTDFDDGELDCEVVENEVAGYTAEYNNGTTTSSDSCEYEDGGFMDANVCTVTNTPTPVEVEVEKIWVVENNASDVIDPTYSLRLNCDNEIVGGYNVGYGNWRKTLYNDDSNGLSNVSYFADVVPDWDGGTHCSVEESVFDAAVEVNNGCENLLVQLGDGDSCSVVNTVFYEGIPTLSNYGLALLTLMMLGVGFVGFRVSPDRER